MGGARAPQAPAPGVPVDDTSIDIIQPCLELLLMFAKLFKPWPFPIITSFYVGTISSVWYLFLIVLK